jgi:hypothetical protein
MTVLRTACAIAASSVVKIWHDHGLPPNRWRSFKLFNDKAFAEKLQDVVGLYISPPAPATVPLVDEKSQIQALDRTRPRLPLKRGRGATMTHDYKRNGTTALFAALNILDGSVIGRNMQRHLQQEFIRFLNAVEPNCRRTRPSTSSSTTTRPTNSPVCAPGWIATRIGHSKSCPRHVHG